MMPWVLVSATIAFVVAALLTRQICNPGSCLRLLDHPNTRSLHTQPTPRTGGVAIFAGFASAIPVWLLATVIVNPIVWLMSGASLIATLSFLDDRRSLPVVVRLLGHMIGAGLVVFGAGLTLPPLFPGISMPLPAWLVLSLSVLFLVWMINLYNFMDGMDGFAAGMAVIGFGTFALLGYLASNLDFVALNLIIVAATDGFLWFNFPPARIFMGDSGSSLLGLLAGGVSIWGAHEVHILQQQDKTLALWNVQYYERQGGGRIAPVFYHFHGLRLISAGKLLLYSGYQVGHGRKRAL